MTELSLSFSGSTSLLQRGCCLIYVHDEYSYIFIAGTEFYLLTALENTDKASTEFR